jgi:hypothetical protein
MKYKKGIEMKYNKLFEISETIKVVMSTSKKVKLNMYLEENRVKINEKLEIFKTVITPTELFNEYELKRKVICEKYADKNEDGTPKIKDEVYVGLENNKSFDKHIEVLRAENKDIIEERELQIKEYDELLKEDIKFDFIKFDIDLIPDDLITGIQQSILKSLFKEIK